MNKSLNVYSRRNQLQPLCELNHTDLNYLFDQSSVVPLEPRTLITLETDSIFFLLEGEVTILSGGFVVEKFNHNDKRALQPLFNEGIEEDSAIITSHGAILNVERRLFDGLYSQQFSASVESSEVLLENSEAALYQHLLDAFEEGKLPLLTLPSAALKIRWLINSPDIDSSEIIQIIQADPDLSARLIKVANSPLYGIWRETKTVADAVRRLGLENTQNMSFSLSIKQLFNAKTTLIKTQIKRVYDETISVSALAYIITQHRANHLDPEQALLAGLVQNLGIIPILNYVDKNPQLVKNIDILDKSLVNLGMPISILLLDIWNFGSDFLNVIEQAENWSRDTHEAIDYADIVIASRLIYLNKEGLLSNTINFESLPLVKKLNLLDKNDAGLYFFETALFEIDDMQQLLRT
jgi:HD-like signal output (HDOD) protein